jgi:predicted DNA-binding transcriptional regulator AlpA
MKKDKAGAVPIKPEQLRAVAEGKDQALSIHALKRSLGLKGNTTVYDYVRRGVLPRPVKIGGSSRWLLSQIGTAA